VKYWEIIADISRKQVGVWAGSQFRIVKGERSGLQTRIAVTEIPTRCSDQKGRSR
jgi:hypothetical protein